MILARYIPVPRPSGRCRLHRRDEGKIGEVVKCQVQGEGQLISMVDHLIVVLRRRHPLRIHITKQSKDNSGRLETIK